MVREEMKTVAFMALMALIVLSAGVSFWYFPVGFAVFLSILLIASSEALVFIVVYYRPSAAVTLSDVELFCPFLSQGSTRTI